MLKDKRIEEKAKQIQKVYMKATRMFHVLQRERMELLNQFQSMVDAEKISRSKQKHGV